MAVVETQSFPASARPTAGALFPDLALPDHTGRPRTLSEIAGGDALVLLTSRGWWCPKEQRYLRNLVSLQDELEVAFAVRMSMSIPIFFEPVRHQNTETGEVFTAADEEKLTFADGMEEFVHALAGRLPAGAVRLKEHVAAVERRGEAAILTSIGLIYGALGERQQAIRYFEQAVPLRKEAGDRRGEAATYTGLGKTHLESGDPEKARDYNYHNYDADDVEDVHCQLPVKQQTVH